MFGYRKYRCVLEIAQMVEYSFATIMQKDVFDHNFQTKALRMTILASGCMFLRSRNPMVPFVFTYDLDLDLSRSWPLRNHILGHISIINVQNVAKC